MATAARKIVSLIVISAMGIALIGCSHPGSDTTTGTQASPASSKANSLQNPKEAALQEAQSLNDENVVPVKDLRSCLAAINGKSDFGPWPAKAFAAYLDPAAFKAAQAAQASGDGTKEINLEGAIHPQADALINQVNPKHTPYISYDMDPLDGAAPTVSAYTTFFTTHHGFPIDTNVAPKYTSAGTAATCVLELAPNGLGGPENGGTGSFDYVDVSDETTAKTISDLVVKHQVHPRFLMKVTGWFQTSGPDNVPTAVHLQDSILKVLLVGPDGKILAQSTGVVP